MYNNILSGGRRWIDALERELETFSNATSIKMIKFWVNVLDCFENYNTRKYEGLVTFCKRILPQFRNYHRVTQNESWFLKYTMDYSSYPPK
jgi:hypothetical protein